MDEIEHAMYLYSLDPTIKEIMNNLKHRGDHDIEEWKRLASKKRNYTLGSQDLNESNLG